MTQLSHRLHQNVRKKSQSMPFYFALTGTIPKIVLLQKLCYILITSMRKFFLLFLLGFSLGCLVPNSTLAENKSLAITSTAQVDSVFELSISQQGTAELYFGEITPMDTPSVRTASQLILLEINSNNGERYQVTQTTSGALENSEGKIIPLENLKFKTSSKKSLESATADFTSLTPESQTVFISDNQSANDTISIEYQLTIPPFQAPGNYTTLLTYTVSST